MLDIDFLEVVSHDDVHRIATHRVMVNGRTIWVVMPFVVAPSEVYGGRLEERAAFRISKLIPNPNNLPPHLYLT